ncbi:MAG: chromate transporter [Bacillota bacterium]|nr:chromate transporter [Bacillota bacterium]
MIYLKLFLSFFQIGLFSFGGGYAALPLIQHQIVDIQGWISVSEMTDIVAISQMTPGPIAINAATFVGTKIGGIIGGVVATLGCITPSCIIMMLISWYFFKNREIPLVQGILTGIRPTIIGLISVACLTMALGVFFNSDNISSLFINALTKIDIRGIAIFIMTIILLKSKKLGTIPVMCLSGIIGAFLYLI